MKAECAFFTGEDGQQRGNGVVRPHAVLIQPDEILSTRRFQPDGFATGRDLYASVPQQLQQGIQVGGFPCEGIINRHAELVPVAGRFTPQPLVVALAPALGIFHDGAAVLNADGVVQPPHRPPGAEEVPEFPVMLQSGGVPDDVVE